MADWNDVDRLATALPEVNLESTRDGLRRWKVRDKLFVWERPLRQADHEALDDSAPGGPILGVRVPDLVAKEAMIAEAPHIYFTTPHFNGYAIVLIQLSHISVGELEEAINEAWLERAPKKVADAWLAQG